MGRPVVGSRTTDPGTVETLGFMHFRTGVVVTPTRYASRMSCADHAAKRARARELRRAGWSRAQIAKEIGVRNSGGLTHWIKDIPAPQWTRRPRAKDDLREQAVALRREGKSYREIQKMLDVARSSLSLWLRDVPLTDEQRFLLGQRKANAGARRAASLRARRIARAEHTHRKAMSMIGTLSRRELFIAGVIAYWAEGSKSKPWRRSERVVFTNSDPTMVSLFLRWLDVVGVARHRIILRIQIHEGADIAAAERCWREIAQLPEHQFRRPTLKRHKPVTVRKNMGPRYIGCLTITVRGSTELYRQIAGWYEGIVNDLGRRPTGRPPDFGSGNERSSRSAPATPQSKLFEPAPAYEPQPAG